MSEKMIEKVKKLLSLSKSDNQHEAESAALMAQKLMAKHGINVVDLDAFDKDETIVEIKVEQPKASTWKLSLAIIVANNFRCKVYIIGKEYIVFYGYNEDAQAAAEVYKFLFQSGHKLALRERAKYKKVSGYGDGVYNSFALGFLSGIKTKLEVQATALMIITPKEVNTSFEEKTKKMKTSSSKVSTQNHVSSAYKNGIAAGKSAMGQRELTAK